MKVFKYFVLPLAIIIASFHLIPALAVLISCAVVIALLVIAIGTGNSWYEEYERRHRDGMDE